MYVDNIYFYNSGDSNPTEPTTAAPTPTQDPASVISIFSDVYTDPASVNYNPNWNQTTDTTIETIAGDEVLKLANLDYQGIEYGTALNISGMDTLHIDYWTPDSTALDVYLISPGPAETPYTVNPVVTGSWQSLERESAIRSMKVQRHHT